MARLGSWNLAGYAPTWFDVTNDVNGWWDQDLVPEPSSPPPPPPPPPVPPRPIPKPSVARSGGYGSSYQYDESWRERRKPKEEEAEEEQEWIQEEILEPEPIEKAPANDVEQTPTPDEEVDYAILPIGANGLVRAMAPGIVRYFVDSKAGPSAYVQADDGVRYFYAGVRPRLHGPEDGDRVAAGDSIGRSVGKSVQSRTETHLLPAVQSKTENRSATSLLPATKAREAAPTTETISEQIVEDRPFKPWVKWVVVVLVGAGVATAVYLATRRRPKRRKRRGRR